MAIDGLDDAAIRRVLADARRIAVVGASPRPSRPSHGVFAFLVGRGYEVTGVNPQAAGSVLHGQKVVAALADAAPLDMVDIFRRSALVGPVVDDAIRLGARVVWMQLGVIDHEAAGRARAGGLTVVMDRCPVIEARRLGV